MVNTTQNKKPPDFLRGTIEFQTFYSKLDEDGEEFKIIKESLDAIRQDTCVGTKIEKAKWPKCYVNEHGINNLYKLNCTRSVRLIYTLVAEGDKIVAIVIDYFSDHKSYEQVFGYD